LAPGMFQQIQTTCDACHGTGRTIVNPCPVCHGSKVVREDRDYNVVIDPGSPKNFDHRIHGEADQSPDWEAGDLIIHVQESREDNMGYRRRGNNLFRKEVLSAKEALRGGWNRSIPFLDGTTNIQLSRKVGSAVMNGEVETIKGKGMPQLRDHGKFGDLYIEYLVILPGGKKKNAHEDL
jgi:DnaJ-related protein SCJ1